MANSNPFYSSSEFIVESSIVSSVYILTDVNRNEFVLGVTAHMENLKRFIDLSSNLNPRYGAPAANRLVYFKAFSNSIMANNWLMELNHFTRKQKERMIVSDNPNWSNLWEEPQFLEKSRLFSQIPEQKERFKSRRKKMLSTLRHEFSRYIHKTDEADKKNSTIPTDAKNRSNTSKTAQSNKIFPNSLMDSNFSWKKNSLSNDYFSNSSFKNPQKAIFYSQFPGLNSIPSEKEAPLSGSIESRLHLHQIDLFENNIPVPRNTIKEKGKKLKSTSVTKRNRAGAQKNLQEYSLF